MRVPIRTVNWVGVIPGWFLLWGATLVVLFPITVSSAVFINGASVAANDDIKGGFAVPAVEDEVMDALEDFRRHVKNKAWEKAFNSMEALRKAEPDQMLPTPEGIILPASEVAARALSEMPSKGREAYRIFFDAKARQLMSDVGTGKLTTEEELAAAQSVYDGYFLTSEGDRAADMLGEVAFRAGAFYKADRYWKAIVDGHPGTDLSVSRLMAKRAIALHRAGDREEFQKLLVEARSLHGNAKVTLGGEEVGLIEYLEAMGPPAQPEVSGGSAHLKAGYLPELDPGAVAVTDPEWQALIVPDFLFKLANVNSSYARSKSVRSVVPDLAADEERLYGNWFGIGFALDLESGKLLWRTESFSLIGKYFNQMYRFDIARNSVAAGGGVMAMVATDPTRMNYSNEPARLWVYDAETGKLRWKTENDNDRNKTRSYAGIPIIRDDEILVASHLVSGSKYELVSLSLKDGKENWKLPLGTAQRVYQSYGSYQSVPSPVTEIHGGILYYLANNGALLAVNLKERRVEWALKCRVPNGTGQRSYYYYNQPPPLYSVLHVEPRMLVQGKHLFFNEARGTRLHRVNTEERSLSWKRPVDEAAVMVGVDADSVYMVSRELAAYDLETMKLRWASKVPMSAGASTALVGDESILVYSRRGIYQVSKSNGDVERILRSEHLNSLGGALMVVGNRLICASNRSITAYPLPAGKPE